jgi:ribonuclease HI
MKLKLYTDGASRGNPGPSGAGGVIFSTDGTVLEEISEYLGIATNNVAEYQALRLTLERASQLDLKSVEVFMDSKLVVEQVTGRWKINNENLKLINNQIQAILPHFKEISFNHIYRNLNRHADALANKAIDTSNTPGISIEGCAFGCKGKAS